ncbi:stalk domain-containing protein [Paenibacillus glycinis]|uniref:Copper amine oxidase-like N-terminal domain-containing protein n=1 Tax=Paenibacillus glycinis TaxID=2697035 RepID=A0ABW9Y146_9BACL|nr:stalk domain-containing protein [Paenibacillus glycinis]NBD28353.1 hypothetical protein [Paenibacillus glycinis]
MFNLRRKIQSAAISSALAGVLAFTGIVSAFGESSPEGAEIKAFILQDTASDIVGAADFTPEGNKDGHFRLQLTFEQKTVIKAVVLRSTDAYGKDNFQGVWRTNRVTTGWLLGIVQDKMTATPTGTTHERTIINPGFHKDLNEPVGQFQGNLYFDLYASNNGTIKETQYYVLEIETSDGTLVSQPIKYKSPMGAEEAPSSPPPSPAPETPIPPSTPAPSQPPSTPSPSPGSTGDPLVQIYFKGQEIRFAGVQPVIKNGTTLVPFRKIFETLGFKVTWVESGNVKKATGMKDGLTIELTINSKTAKVNGRNVNLSTPAQAIKGSTMVPLRFVAENSGYAVSNSRSGNVTTIKIEDPANGDDPGPSGEPTPTPAPLPEPKPTPEPSQPPSQEAVEPYVVKGYVRNALGQPLKGVEVIADNTLLYNSNIIGVTDGNGFYRIELEKIATSWSMTADYKPEYNGKDYTFHMEPEVATPFAGKTGAVRDFTLTEVNGQIFVYQYLQSDYSLPDFKLSDLEMTLTPIGPLLDGTTGETIVKHVGSVDGGLGLGDIPIGRYKATARWLPEGHDPIPMLIRINYTGEYAESVDFEFNKPRGTITSNYLAELEVKPAISGSNN